MTEVSSTGWRQLQVYAIQLICDKQLGVFSLNLVHQPRISVLA
jgi:hypothetical protein